MTIYILKVRDLTISFPKDITILKVQENNSQPHLGKYGLFLEFLYFHPSIYQSVCVFVSFPKGATLLKVHERFSIFKGHHPPEDAWLRSVHKIGLKLGGRVGLTPWHVIH